MLTPGGTFLAKVFQGGAERQLLEPLKRRSPPSATPSRPPAARKAANSTCLPRGSGSRARALRPGLRPSPCPPGYPALHPTVRRAIGGRQGRRFRDRRDAPQKGPAMAPQDNPPGAASPADGAAAHRTPLSSKKHWRSTTCSWCPSYSQILPARHRYADPLTQAASRLNIPLISSAMDTVTESTHGDRHGPARRHRGDPQSLAIEEQAAQVRQVKKFKSGMVINPVTIHPNQTLADARGLMEHYHISGIPVVGARNRAARRHPHQPRRALRHRPDAQGL